MLILIQVSRKEALFSYLFFVKGMVNGHWSVFTVKKIVNTYLKLTLY